MVKGRVAIYEDGNILDAKLQEIGLIIDVKLVPFAPSEDNTTLI